MIRAMFLVLAMLVAAVGHVAPAHAQDARLQERFYDPGEVVRLDGKAGVQATISFGTDEVIENVAIGDSQSWQVTPNKRADLLFVKPLSASASTNMTVVTNRRTYLFDLVASPRNRPLYMLKFTYPPEPEAEADAVIAQAPNAMERAAANDPYAVVDPAELNFAWASDGDTALLPARIYDDGQATFLAWNVDKPVPAILVTDRKGTEGPVNFTVRGDTIVVDGVPAAIVLRSGKQMATLTNAGPPRTISPPRAVDQPLATFVPDPSTAATVGGIR